MSLRINWIKKGKIFEPDRRFDWMMNYAQVPTVLQIENKLRIYFTTRSLADKNKCFMSYTTFLDVDRRNPGKILYIHNKPILKFGGPGSFDEFGIHPTSIIKYGNKVYLYYQGWTRGITVPYITSLGLAISNDKGKTFKKYSKGPLFSRTPDEPFLENGFFVFREGEKWHMWYSSCSEWKKINNKYEPIYNIVYSSSKDGINWERNGKKCFNNKVVYEVNNRPTVIKINKTYHMWFCYRGISDFRGGKESYRIGYATSTDLKYWKRNDESSGITVSQDGWDSQMIAYPNVIKNKNKLLMFYNGNEFGKYGFGYAELVI
jgi:predicted GH43/DUF377 family glycosyl hydrolase